MLKLSHKKFTVKESNTYYCKSKIQVETLVIVIFVEEVAQERVDKNEGEDVESEEFESGDQKSEADGVWHQL